MMVPSNHSFVQYFDSNIGFFSNIAIAFKSMKERQLSLSRKRDGSEIYDFFNPHTRHNHFLFLLIENTVFNRFNYQYIIHIKTNRQMPHSIAFIQKRAGRWVLPSFYIYLYICSYKIGQIVGSYPPSISLLLLLNCSSNFMILSTCLSLHYQKEEGANE